MRARAGFQAWEKVRAACSRAGGWQWLGGSGVIRCSGARRFEWCNFQSGSGSIGRGMTVQSQYSKNQKNCSVNLTVQTMENGCGTGGGSGWVGVVSFDSREQRGSNGTG
jgi:hypothetical protein